MNAATPFWTYLAEQPLFWLGLTLAAYLSGDRLALASGRHPLVNPVLIAVALVAAVLIATNTPYARYFAGAQFVHVLLGPATVALALPIVRHAALIRRNALAVSGALLIGAGVGVASAVGLAWAFGLPANIVASLAPKSVTAAIAMGVSEQAGGSPTLTAGLVISTGILGAVMVAPLLNLCRVKNYAARGFAVGLAAHGIGTARALSVDETAGAHAALAMALNGLATALIVPIMLGI